MHSIAAKMPDILSNTECEFSLPSIVSDIISCDYQTLARGGIKKVDIGRGFE
jgi:hypothetical protein